MCVCVCMYLCESEREGGGGEREMGCEGERYIAFLVLRCKSSGDVI